MNHNYQPSSSSKSPFLRGRSLFSGINIVQKGSSAQAKIVCCLHFGAASKSNLPCAIYVQKQIVGPIPILTVPSSPPNTDAASTPYKPKLGNRAGINPLHPSVSYCVVPEVVMLYSCQVNADVPRERSEANDGAVPQVRAYELSPEPVALRGGVRYDISVWRRF